MIFKTAISISTLIILVSTMLVVQTHVKLKPTSVIAIYTSLTIIFLVLKKDKISTVLLAPIILLCSYFFWYLICDKIKDAMFPFHQDPEHYVMDTSYVYYIPMAIILGALTTFLYFTKAARHKKSEIYILTIYLISTLAIICYKHL
jgi:hypothetical protein